MRRTFRPPGSDRDRGSGTADAFVGLILLATLLLVAASLVRGATDALARSEQALRLDLESRRSLIGE